MKSSITLLVGLLAAFASHGQMVYYDAQLLKQKLVNKKFPIPTVNCVTSPNDPSCIEFEEWTTVFKPYVPTNVQGKPSDIATYLHQENPFLKDLIVLTTSHSGGFTSSMQLESLVSSSSAATPQGLTSKVVDGIAKFLVKRTKEELTTAFFEQFNAVLEKQKDLQILFPSTYQILKTATTEIFNYQAYLPSLREAFEYDLDNFFSNAFEWTKSSDGNLIQRVASDSLLYTGLKTSFYIGRELDLGTHPGDVLKSVVALDTTNARHASDSMNLSVLHPNLSPMLQTANLFSQALRSDNSERYWITENQFQSFRDPIFIRIFFGLVYQQIILDPVPIQFEINSGVIALSEVLKKAAQRTNELQALIRSFDEKLTGIQKEIEAIRNTPDRNHADYVRLAKDIFGLTSVASNNKLLIEHAIPIPSSVWFYVEHISGLWSHIESKSYNSAVFEAYAILDKAIPAEENRETLKAFLKYGTFMATVATAETSDEVALAVEAIVLPPGSASIKRKSKSNISLNAYVGLSPGYEWKNTPSDNGGFVFAVNAPIGIAFSKGHYEEDKAAPGKFKEKGSSSFFVSLVDLGAVTAYRFDDSNTAVLPELKFSNIFAPGLYYVWGVPRFPISLGLGGQLGPQLRDIEGSTTTIDDTLSITFKFFVAVDIPLLNFYTKSR